MSKIKQNESGFVGKGVILPIGSLSISKYTEHGIPFLPSAPGNKKAGVVYTGFTFLFIESTPGYLCSVTVGAVTSLPAVTTILLIVVSW
jgi:hypothetical protein